MKIKIVLLLVFLSLIACGNDDQAGPGIETGNTGKIILSNGKPANGATVKLFLSRKVVDADDKEFEPVLVTKTDEEGNYTLKVEKSDVYAMMASYNGEFSYQDSLEFIADEYVDVVDTLHAPGAVKGKIADLSELNDMQSMVAHIINTDLFVNMGAKGDFLIDDIPAGDYTLAIISSIQKEFAPTYLEITITSGDTLDLTPKPITPIYSGIPFVSGLKLSYDTLTGVVNLKWDSLDYRHLQSYQVQRAKEIDGSRNWETIVEVKSPSYLDTIFSEDPFVTRKYPYTTIGDFLLDYRVLVYNKFDSLGSSYGFESIKVVSAFNFLPSFSVVDTLKVAKKTKATIGVSWEKDCVNCKIEWKVDDGDWEEKDSLTYQGSNKLEEIIKTAEVRVTNDRGLQIKKSVVIKDENRFDVLSTNFDFSKYPTQMIMKGSEFWILENRNDLRLYTSKDGVTWELKNDNIPLKMNSLGGLFNFYIMEDTLHYYSINDNDSTQLIEYITQNGMDWKTDTLQLDYAVKSLGDVAYVKDLLYISVDTKEPEFYWAFPIRYYVFKNSQIKEKFWNSGGEDYSKSIIVVDEEIYSSGGAVIWKYEKGYDNNVPKMPEMPDEIPWRNVKSFERGDNYVIYGDGNSKFYVFSNPYYNGNDYISTIVSYNPETNEEKVIGTYSYDSRNIWAYNDNIYFVSNGKIYVIDLSSLEM